MSLDRDPYASPLRRIVITAVVPLLAICLLMVLLPRWLTSTKPHPPEGGRESVEQEPPAPVLSDSEREDVRRGWTKSAILAPRAERVDPATGEVTLPFHGFGVSVDSTPEGARVLIDGHDAGETPLTASVPCLPGTQVEVRVEKSPHRPESKNTRCRADTLVKLAVTLRR